MKTIYHKQFIKAYSKLTEKLKDKTDERLRLFRVDPFAEILNNHGLNGAFAGHGASILRVIIVPFTVLFPKMRFFL